MAVWPGTLPAYPLVDGYGEAFEDRRVVFECEYGPARVRPKSTVPVRTFTASYILTSTQIATLETFYRVTTKAGELRFDWAHPRPEATPTTLQARFTGAPHIVEAVRKDLWRTTITLDALLSPVPTGTGSLTWPTSLPTWPLLQGYDEQFAELAIQSEMPVGAPLARRRTTSATRPIRANFILTPTQAALLDGFFESDTVGGAAAFTWDHPVLGSVASAFIDGPKLSVVQPGIYRVDVTVEVLP